MWVSEIRLIVTHRVSYYFKSGSGVIAPPNPSAHALPFGSLH